MELDDQLAALAAGELDDDTARALRARAAADPAVARRLARHERLEDLLTDWTAPPLRAEAVARIDAAVDEALAELGDEPLADRAAPTGPLSAVPASTSDDDAAPAATATAAAAGGDGVVDLGAARQRRAERRGLPAWVPSATVAAALLAVVGTGVLAGGGLFSGEDSATDDMMADAPTEESAEETMDADTDDSAAAGLAESDEMAQDEMAASEPMEDTAALGPAERRDVDLAEGELLALLDASGAETTSGDDEAAGDADTGEAEEGADGAGDACVAEALERDTTQTDGREVWQLASGRYAGRDAVFVVIRSPSDQPGDRYEVLAYDPGDCSLLARDETTR